MKLDENYQITTDSNNFVLRYEKMIYDEVKQKDVKSTSQWHCRSLSHALDIYMNEGFRGCEDITSLRAELERVEELIKTVK